MAIYVHTYIRIRTLPLETELKKDYKDKTHTYTYTHVLVPVSSFESQLFSFVWFKIYFCASIFTEQRKYSRGFK